MTIDDRVMLPGLKLDLGIVTTMYDDRLIAKLSAARERLAAEGVTLTDSEEDQELVVMFAAYLWRSRGTGADMPRMLRYAINNRVFGQKAGAQGA